MPEPSDPARPEAPAAVALVSLLLATGLLSGCSTAAPCPGSAAVEAALSSLGPRAWDGLTEADVLPAWPSALTREKDAAAFRSDGAAVPYRLWVRAEREDRRGCVCCQALEFGAEPGRTPALNVVSLHLFAPSWEEASRTAARLLLAGLPPHVSVRLSVPPGPPGPGGLPWETSAPWTSDPDPDGGVLTGSAFLQIDRGAGGWVVLARHERPAR